jgi:AcrR family transcriptional regulator
MFATRGYSQTSVRDIAREAGLLSGSLYHHFSSKEDIAAEVLRDFMSGLHARFEQIAEAAPDAQTALEGLVREAFRAIHESPYAVALYQNETALFKSTAEFAFVMDASLTIERVWRGVLVAGRSSGQFRADLDPNLAYQFIRDTVWSSVRWYNPRGRYPHKRIADQFLLMLYGGLLKD